MFMSRFASIALAVACIAAAGAGGYLAFRHNGSTPVASVQQVAGTNAALPAPQTPSIASSTPAVAASVADRPSAVVPGTSAPRPPATDRGNASPAPEVTATMTRVPESRPAPPDTVAASSISPAAPPQAMAIDSVPSTSISRTDTLAGTGPLLPQSAPADAEQLVVEADSVIGLEMDQWVGSESARLEDKVEARVTRDVRVEDKVAIPAGTRAMGTVVMVERGGRFRERARIGVRFDTLRFQDGTELAVSTETIYRFGRPPRNATAARIGGGAVVGAIVGGVLGGGKGAAIGATAGAGTGAAAVIASERDEAYFPAGAEVTARLLSPILVTTERD